MNIEEKLSMCSKGRDTENVLMCVRKLEKLTVCEFVVESRETENVLKCVSKEENELMCVSKRAAENVQQNDGDV